MNAETLKKLEAEAGHPRGVAARIESVDLRQLLDERAEALRLLDDADFYLSNPVSATDPKHALRVKGRALLAKAGAP